MFLKGASYHQQTNPQQSGAALVHTNKCDRLDVVGTNLEILVLDGSKIWDI
jgi:hypothetical protein